MDRYRVEKVVGKGSFGQAILCARISDDKACIVKQVDTSKLPSKARREASKEATLLAKLSHPNIVGFWESFLHGPSRDVLCIVMDYADGGDLSSCLRRRNGRPLDEETILDWFVQTTLALKHIHDRKILHRDLKTQNIFLTRSRVVKLGDFGIAKVLGNTLDLAKTAIGTPYYMSPEICQEKRYNHKSDMWSLGCVLYEMTCLRHAFDGSNIRLLVMKICSQDPRPISARYSSGVRSLVAQLLKKDPHARPSTGGVLRRPLIKSKIGRFLSEAQIREEFSDGVSPGQQPSSAAATSNDTGAAASPSLRSGADRAAPRWPFHAAGIGRPHHARAAPRSMAGDGDGRHIGRAMGGAGGGKAARAAGWGGGRGRAAAEEEEKAVDERRRAEALARNKGVRAAAKQRGQLAAVALNIARPSSAERRLAKPNRPKSAEDAASKQQRDARQARERALDAKRAQERAEIARAALGVGGRRPSPGRASRHRSSSISSNRGDGTAQAPHRPSARAPLTGAAAGPGAGAGREDGTAEEGALQGGQNARGRGGGSPAGGVAEGLAQPRRPSGGGGSEGVRNGAAQPGRIVGAAGKYDVGGMTAALESARRRRAARAVFGPGFGSEEPEGVRPQHQGVEEGKRRDSEVKRTDRGGSPAADMEEGSPAILSRQAEEKPVTPTAPREPSAEAQEEVPPSEPEQALDDLASNRFSDNNLSTPGGEGKGGCGREDKVDQHHLHQRQDRQEQVRGFGVVAPESFPCVAEEKGHREERDVSIKGVDGGVAEEKGVAVGGSGDGDVRSNVDLGLKDGWFQNLEAKMGAIKKQVEQIKSPPLSSPRRRDVNHRDQAGPTSGSVRQPVEPAPRKIFETPSPPPRYPREPDSDQQHQYQGQQQQARGSRGRSDDDDNCGGNDEEIDWSVGDGPPVIGSVTPLAERAGGFEEEKAWRRGDGSRPGERGDYGAEDSGARSDPSAIGEGRGGEQRGDDASRPAGLRGSTSQQQTDRLAAAAAAVEVAAAAVEAISPSASESDQTPGVRRHSSESDLVGRHDYRRRRPADQEDADEGKNETGRNERVVMPTGRVGGAGSGSARARISPPGGPGGVRVVTTPAQRGGGGRVARRPPLSSRSERKPPRHAAALAAELGRHSDKRPQKPVGKDFKLPRRDDEIKKAQAAKTPSTEERVQALRATRDREREALRALIARKRRQSSKENVDAGGSGGGGGGGGDGAGLGIGAPKSDSHNDPDGPLLQQECSSPIERTAAVGQPRHGGGVGGPASEPPPRRGSRFQTTPSDEFTGGAAGAAGAHNKEGGGSVDASHRRRRQGGKGDVGGGRGAGHGDPGGAAGERGGAGAKRDPANKRHQDLRAFVAERRRNQRARRSMGSDGEGDSGISVLVPPGGRIVSPGHGAFTAAEVAETEEEEEGPGGGVAAARRNIGLDFDEEDRAWGAKGGAREAGGCAREEKEREVKAKDEDGGDSSGGGDESHASLRSLSAPSWENESQEGDAGLGEADALEGVSVGLATYDSQRSAGVESGSRAGQEEYARMLELMQQEVLELGDGASTDSGWGESSSSSGERKSSSRDDGSDERSGGSGDDVGEGFCRGSGGSASCVSTPELAVFLFQGGVDSGCRSGVGSSGGGDAEGDEGSSPVPQGQREGRAELPSPVDPSAADDKQFSDLEYSRTGPRGPPREASEDAAPGMLGCAAAEDGSAAACDERSRAATGVNPSDNSGCRRQEPVVVVANGIGGNEEKEGQELGTPSSSLTGGLRGVHFVLN